MYPWNLCLCYTTTPPQARNQTTATFAIANLEKFTVSEKLGKYCIESGNREILRRFIFFSVSAPAHFDLLWSVRSAEVDWCLANKIFFCFRFIFAYHLVLYLYMVENPKISWLCVSEIRAVCTDHKRVKKSKRSVFLTTENLK